MAENGGKEPTPRCVPLTPFPQGVRCPEWLPQPHPLLPLSLRLSLGWGLG